MIVPTNRLMLWVSLIVLPFAALAGAAPETALLGWAVIAGLLILVTADAVRSLSSLRGVALELPDVARLTRDREEEMGLRVRNETARAGFLRVGLAFPPEVVSPKQDMSVRLRKGEEATPISWPLKGLKNGRYGLDRYYLETPSPLGFWSRRRSFPVEMEIRIYPNLAHDHRVLALRPFSPAPGSRAQRQVGKGRDFEHLREYMPGDSYEDIHWKATARRGRPVTKIFQAERMQEIYLIVDASRLSARGIETPGMGRESGGVSSGPSPLTVLDRYISAALMLGLAAERQGDLFGLLTFSDRVERFIRARNGKAHYDACRDAVYTLEARHVSPDFAELFTFIGTRIRRRALLIFLTGLDDPVLSTQFVSHVDLVTRRHLVRVNMLRPASAQPLFSSEQDVYTVNDIYRHLGGHMAWAALMETEKLLRRRGAGFALLDNEALCAELHFQYMSVKRRQAL
ncbi:MAG: DUF58 domain-containing protein [Desulfobacteraceae bacterium]|jgi:uncharacterized protein (DUF58 family)